MVVLDPPMKKQISLQCGATSVALQRWPDSKQRPVWTPPLVLVLALFTLFTGSAAYAQVSKLTNISSLLLCQTGEAAVVSEFVIQGGAAKQVLVRAIGPSLNVPGPLADPTMELRDSAGGFVGANNNWKDSQQAAIEATGLPPANNLESAIVATLAPGLYFTVIRGVSNTNGVALSEVYDLGGSASSFTALGTRGYVGTSDDVLVSGVILSGSQNQDVLVRALGSSLANSGLSAALPNPMLELRDVNGSLLSSNDNWGDTQETAIQSSGLAPSNVFESAIIATLSPGNYTSIVRGAQNSVGLGFVQYYALPYSGSVLDPAPSLLALPVITSPLAASGTVGQLFTYQFEASEATSLAVTNSPPGLAFDSALQAIVGNPTASGTFQTGLSATNAAGTTSATLTITVQQPPSSGPSVISSTAVTGRTGRFFEFQVITTGGSPAAQLSVSGLPPGLVADPVTGLISGTPTSDGSFAVTLTVMDGPFTATSRLQLTFTSDLAVPVIISPSSASLIPGQFFAYTINAPATADPSDPTSFTLFGTLPTGLTFDSKTGTISGTFMGSPLRDRDSPDRNELSGGIVTNVQLFAKNSHGTSTLSLVFFLAPKGAVNISTRLRVGRGDDVLIGGFIITGNAPKKLILRAIAPSLRKENAPLPGTLPDPTLKLYEGDILLGENNDWRESQEDEIIGTSIPPTAEKESAILAVLNPGSYTAIVAGATGVVPDTGIAVVEVYDLGTASLDANSKSRLANISSRGVVLENDDVMIGGFIISGTTSKILVRAIGPSIKGLVPGALGDTMLELHNSSGDRIARNDDWKVPQDGGSEQSKIEETTIAPQDEKEAAILALLNPGAYTAIVRGKNETGVAVVEVYVLE